MRDPLANPQLLIRRVYAYVSYRIGDGPDAEDVTSAAFERALRYRDSFDPNRGDAAAWMIGIARRCISEAALRRETPTDDLLESEVEGAEDATARRLDLRTQFMQLDERDRELLALRYGADLTAKQIAALLGMKTNAVEVALHRALTRLRKRLDPPAQGEGASVAPVRV
jgi:RNA polymerase sigma-70 factor (ECF subfamily)